MAPTSPRDPATACPRKYTDKDGVERRATEIVIGRFDGRLSLEGQPAAAPARDEHGYGTTRTKDDPRTMQQTQSTADRIDDDIPF